MMENHNPYVRLVAYGKIKKMISQFKGKQINSLERNMMRGLFTRKLKDYAEDVRNNNRSLFDRIFGQPVPEGSKD
jgi:hypothetical protein